MKGRATEHLQLQCTSFKKLGTRAPLRQEGNDESQGLELTLVVCSAGQNIRKLVKDGFVIKKPQVIHSRARARAAQEAKVKGRHCGPGAPYDLPGVQVHCLDSPIDRACK